MGEALKVLKFFKHFAAKLEQCCLVEVKGKVSAEGLVNDKSKRF